MKRTPIALQAVINTFSDNGGSANNAAKLRGILTDICDSLNISKKSIYFEDFDFIKVENLAEIYDIETFSDADCEFTIINSCLKMQTFTDSGDKCGIASASTIANRAETPYIFSRLKLDAAWDDIVFNLGLYFDSNNYAFISIGDEYKDGKLTLIVNIGGTLQSFHSTIIIGTNFTDLEIWCDTDGTIHWAVAGAEQLITGITNKLSADQYKFVVYVQASESSSAKIIHIDKLRFEKTI